MRQTTHSIRQRALRVAHEHEDVSVEAVRIDPRIELGRHVHTRTANIYRIMKTEGLQYL